MSPYVSVANAVCEDPLNNVIEVAVLRSRYIFVLAPPIDCRNIWYPRPNRNAQSPPAGPLVYAESGPLISMYVSCQYGAKTRGFDAAAVIEYIQNSHEIVSSYPSPESVDGNDTDGNESWRTGLVKSAAPSFENIIALESAYVLPMVSSAEVNVTYCVPMTSPVDPAKKRVVSLK